MSRLYLDNLSYYLDLMQGLDPKEMNQAIPGRLMDILIKLLIEQKLAINHLSVNDVEILRRRSDKYFTAMEHLLEAEEEKLVHAQKKEEELELKKKLKTLFWMGDKVSIHKERKEVSFEHPAHPGEDRELHLILSWPEEFVSESILKHPEILSEMEELNKHIQNFPEAEKANMVRLPFKIGRFKNDPKCVILIQMETERQVNIYKEILKKALQLQDSIRLCLNGAVVDIDLFQAPQLEPTVSSS